ncbi:MAG: hypothetical protein J6B28_00445, partial [Eubacterium sp.]|nr:hypothetical protein [Eubacterium sp.]
MKTKKRRRIIGIIVGVVAVLVVCVALFLAGAWSMFGEKVTAAMTVEKLEDGLYTMCYEGDYGFDAYMEQGGAGSSEEMANYITSFLSNGFYSNDANVTTSADFGCSTITVKDAAGNVCFGRNYDWDKCMTMIVHTKPENGY